MFGADAIRCMKRPGGVQGYKFWRLYITETRAHLNYGDSAYSCELVEVEFRETPGVRQRAAGGTPSHSTADSWRTSGYCFDGDLADSTLVWRTPQNNPPPQWVQYEFAEPISCLQLSIIGPTNAGSRNYSAPHAFELQGSNDGVTYTAVLTVESQSVWGAYEERLFNV